MTALRGDHDLGTFFTGSKPAADHLLASSLFLAFPVPIDQGRIQKIPAPFRIQIHLPERVFFRYARSVLCRSQRQMGNFQAAGS